MEEKKFNKLNRTFARRIGKTLSPLNKNILATELPKHIYSPEKIIDTEYKKTFLEVGFGMGEHFVNQVQSNPDFLYIGAEVYLNGVANVFKKIEATNFMIWPDDLDEILEKIPAGTIDGIYVLFPDPWHKKRYLKKRLFNQARLQSFKATLKDGGFIAFASDIDDYFADARKLLESDSNFSVQRDDFTIPHEGYIQTKYHAKAIREGRVVQFIEAKMNH
ncbi:hypothetical protein N9N97_02230 [Rickettsiaceae bacterium]|nr:hypothetical protein [Rickettsiaceae bacterium]